MKTFVDKKCQSALFYLCAIRKIRKYLTSDASKTLVNALVTSRLDYANSLLYGINKSYIHKVQLVQNAAARVISMSNKYDHITPVLFDLHWLPVAQRIVFKLLCFTYSCYHGTALSYLVEIVQRKEAKRELRSNNNMILQHKVYNSQYGQRSFVNSGPLLWNKLPKKLKACSSLDNFKKHLKTYLFNQYFSSHI